MSVEVLYEDILEKKHRVMMARHFQKIVEQSRIKNFLYPELSKAPKSSTAKRREMPAGSRAPWLSLSG